MSLKRPLVVGSKGNMGRRYMAILGHLGGVEPRGIDLGEVIPTDYDSVILATPTSQHVEQIFAFEHYRVPILCEKPISTSLARVMGLFDKAKTRGIRLRMVNQYADIARFDPNANGPTFYDYFRHGSDGLAWDCINIIGMAKWRPTLSERSPIWSCTINGQKLSVDTMDAAYVQMVKDWLAGGHENLDYMLNAHRKVAEYIAENALCAMS